MDGEKFGDLFDIEKPLIGMIHLAGDGREEKVKRALDELRIYDEEGIEGAIIEDYHGGIGDVVEVLSRSANQGLRLIRGVNILRDLHSAFELAKDYGAKFVQFDSVQSGNFDPKSYGGKRRKHPEILVLGGVGFKYIPETGNSLKDDLRTGMGRCEAIVTTGAGTGIETPLDKLINYKGFLGNFPLIVGAGVNAENIRGQLKVADGAIIGSYFKPNGKTQLPIEREKVRELVKAVREIRGIRN